MENAADGIKMAGAVLIFVLAISIIILAFGQVRETADILLDYKDRETTYSYYKPTDVRYVNMETIIPTIFRSYIDNYKIVIKDSKGEPIELYSIISNDGSRNHYYSIDLSTLKLADNGKKAEFLCGILYHDYSKMPGSSNYEKEQYFKTTNFGMQIDVPSTSLSDRLKGNKFKEYTGIYVYNDAPLIVESMKRTKRIITYLQIK